MDKILQKNKLYKILIGMIVFLCAGMSVDAAKVNSIWFDESNNTLNVTINDTAGIQSVQGSCSTKYYSIPKTEWLEYKFFDGKKSTVTVSWDVSNFDDTTYECYFYSDRVWGNQSKTKTVDVEISKKSEDDTEKYYFKVKFDSNEGVFTQNNNKATWNWTCEAKAAGNFCDFTSDNINPSRSGYAFKGWSTDPNCLSISSINKVREATTFYACWTKDTDSSSGSYDESGYKVIFDENYGFGLACDAGFIAPTNGVCEKTGIKAGETVNYPSSSKSMTRDDYYLIGWTNVVTNGKPDCSKGVLEKNLEAIYTVNANTDFYACYEEYINGERYVVDGYSVDGNSSLTCGSPINIEYCTKEPNGNFCYSNDSANPVKVYRDKLTDTPEAALAYCNGQDKGERFVKVNGDNYTCGDKLYITTCNETTCNYTKIITSKGNEIVDEGTISSSYLDDNANDAKKACDALEEEESEFDKLKSCTGDYRNESQNNMTDTQTYSFCYKKTDSNEERNEKIKRLYSCKKGYVLTSIYNADNKKTCNKNGICVNEFAITCSVKPILTVSSGVIKGNEKVGYITVEASSKAGQIVSYYASEYYKAPTNSDDGWINVNSGNFTIESSPGIKYIWVKDIKGNISDAVSGAVLDTVNSDTTAKDIYLYDENNNLQALNRTVAYDTRSVRSSKYVMMSNQLKNDSKVIADGFNPYDMEYEIEVESPTVSVYVTLTSTDSKYVPGYEPRTVNLDYGVNTILIKIENKEGKVRTYTILATRVDDRTSDNTLNDLTVSVGNINFNSNVTDYKIEIPESTKSVDVSSKIASDKASYITGYEPGNVKITGDTTVKLIKVKSQTGSTRTYVITFVKEGTDKITKESLQLDEIVIPNANLPFESDVANYSLSVGYEQSTIDLVTTLKNKDSIVSISVKRKNETNYTLSSDKGINLDVGENFIEIKVIDKENEVSYYRITIIRKEFGLDISNDTTLKDLRVLGYDIQFNPNKKDYTVRIKKEKSLAITAVPNSNRAEVFIRGNDELTGFSTVRVKVVSENGEFETYSIDIKKDAFNKTIEIASIVAGVVIILVTSSIIIVKKKAKAKREYIEE